MKIKQLQITLLILICINLKAQIQIHPTFFGLNYWFTKYTGAPFTSSLIIPTSTIVNSYNSATGSKLMRVGGTGYNLYHNNNNPLYPSTNTGSNSIVTPAGYVKIVDDVRKNGFEPMIQVPYDDRSKIRGLEEQAADAAAIVREVNIVHKRNVKYWIISNEPTNDQGAAAGYSDPMGLDENRKVSTYLKKYSVAMKLVDPNIKIIGPELTSDYGAGLVQLFADPVSSISVTGQIGSTFDGVTTPTNVANKYFVDYASFHSYPGYAVTSYTPYRKAYVDLSYSLATQYQSVFDNTLTGSYNDHLEIMLDEFNMSSGSYTVAYSGSSVSQESLNANTFLAGQLVADMMGAMLTTTRTATTTPYSNCNLWSSQETEHTGYISTNDERKATYWHYWFMSNFFKGEAYKNLTPDPGLGNVDRCYRAYACKGPDYIAVLVMNQAQTSNSVPAIGDGSSSKNFTISFSNTISATFQFSMNVSQTYTANIPNKSTSLYFFDCAGSYLGQYDLAESTLTANISATPTPTGTIPPTPSLTISGNDGCYGSTATITAASNADWYLGPDYSSTIATGVASITTTSPGIFAARITGSCTNYWLVAVVNQTAPIISTITNTINTLNCIGITSAQISASITPSASIVWTPTTGLSCSTCTNPLAYPSGTGVTAYTASVTLSGCSTTETVNVIACNSNSVTQDLYIKDYALDNATEPSTPPFGLFWVFSDMWISPNYSGAPANAEYKTNGEPNYVHVIVSNNGTATASGKLNVYWTKSITSASYTPDWVNATVTHTNGTKLRFGDQIGSPSTVSVAGTSSLEVIIPWVVPNPGDYNFPPFISTYQQQHFCLYARLETGCGMTTSETGVTSTDVINNNNIAQRNVAIVDNNTTNIAPPGPLGDFHGVLFHNAINDVINTKLAIVSYSNALGKDIFDYGNPYLQLSDDLYDLWVEGGSTGDHVEDMGDNLIKITGNNATLDNIDADALMLSDMGVRFTFTAQANEDYNFDVDLMHYENNAMMGPVLLGGERYEIIPSTCPTLAVAESTINIDLGCTATPSVVDTHTSVEYKWYVNASNSLIATSSSVNVSPTVTTVYRVDAAENGCLQSETVAVVVSTLSCEGRMMAPGTKTESVIADPEIDYENISFGLKPNPTADRAIISYDIEGLNNAELVIVNSYGQQISKTVLDPKRRRYTVDCAEFKNGLYYVSLTSGGKTIRTLKMVVMK
jgi:hypothetical protein